ncbi:MAG: oligosaccharide flippase family protein [Acetobacteraceae bacterium]
MNFVSRVPPNAAGLRRLVWPVTEAAVAAALSLISSFVVARLVGPAEVGIAAAAISVHVLLWVGVNALFADALVQRETVTDAELASAFWASVAVGVAAMAVQAGSGWVLAWGFEDARLVLMALALAPPLPLVGAAGVMQGLMTRRQEYRRVALRTVIGHGCGTACGVAGALSGWGAWAMVSQQCVTSLLGAVVLLAGAGWKPVFAWHWAAVRALLTTGLPLTASTLVLMARYRLFAVLVGGWAGAPALGQVHMAFRLVDTVRDLAFTALWRLFLPDLSRFQRDRSGMLARVDRLLAASSLLTLPLCGALAVSLVPFVAVALGPQWQEAGAAAVPLSGLMAMLALTFPSGVALVAAGKARFTLYGNLAGLVLALAGVALFRPERAESAVLIWCASQAAVLPYALWVNARALEAGPLRPLQAAWPMAITTAAAVLAALALPAPASAPIPLIAWRGLILAAITGGAIALLIRPFPMIRTWRSVDGANAALSVLGPRSGPAAREAGARSTGLEVGPGTEGR